MVNKWEKGLYHVQNPAKYVGSKHPTFRSSWERKFMEMCDAHPNIVKWASENVRIPYRHPVTGKATNYVPDFMVQYVDKDGKESVELVEIKPAGQTTMEAAGRSQRNQIEVHVNAAKWSAAQDWCKSKGIKFRVINEDQIFHTNKKRMSKKRVSKPRKPRRGK